MNRTPVDVLAAAPLKRLDAAALTIVIRDHIGAAADLDRVDGAIQLAVLAHLGQTRADRDSMPRTHYIEHPLRNAVRLLRFDCRDVDTIIVALLHDVVEDGAVEICSRMLDLRVGEAGARERVLDLVDEAFGRTVHDALLGMTNPLGHPGASRDQRNEEYRAKVIGALPNPRTALNKAADLLDNAGSLRHHLDLHPQMVRRLAAKYAPVLPAVIDRVEQADILALLPASGVSRLVDQLLKTNARVNDITATAGEATV